MKKIAGLKIIVQNVGIKRQNKSNINNKRGISIFDEQDIVEYESISEAARQENIERSSLQKHLRGDSRYSKVKNRIWIKIER